MFKVYTLLYSKPQAEADYFCVQVNFTLSNDGGVFAVSSSGEVIVAGELDRETQAEYNITIIVTDRSVSSIITLVLV